jgi:hypothetical protein
MAVSADWFTIASRLVVLRNAPLGPANPKISIMIAIANTVPYFETITSAIRLAGLDASGLVGGGVSAAVSGHQLVLHGQPTSW